MGSGPNTSNHLPTLYSDERWIVHLFVVLENILPECIG
jgi:hypothetical protein